jgi:hypothetical protein
MRQGQQNKRMRGRSRKGPNPLARAYESNGPDVKIRGTALHIAEKYLQLARDAQSSGDRVAGENYLQHAEHYFRIVAAAQAQMPQPQPAMRTDSDDDDDDDRVEADRVQPQPFVQPTFGLSDPQPYINGNGQGRSDGNDDGGNGSDDGRHEAREGRDQGGYRGRRRRPYRERPSNDQAEAGGAETPPLVPSEPAGGATTSED